VCLCTGCWLEGGPGMGGDVLEAVRTFGGMGKLFKVHLRNVTAPMPEGFEETYLDNGYMDMYRIAEALHEVGYDGAVMSDHLPRTIGGDRAAEALAVGTIKGYLRGVQGAS
jgi:mannonate dehydratase